MSRPFIHPFSQDQLLAAKQFTDSEIGQDYYTLEELTQIRKNSMSNGINCSLSLWLDQELIGLRLSYPPGQWQSGKGEGLSSHLWPHKLESTAYFQSLFIKKNYRGQGWGKKLSLLSIERLKKTGALGVVCHSWKESPGHTSTAYLQSLGFRTVTEYPLYWKEVDYSCTRCGRPCLCTAVEMYKSLA